ncbi:MAG: FAD-dependent oxidoreductase [Burkholderiaceae bacterium]
MLQTIDGARHAFDVVYAALGVQPRSQFARSVGAQLDGRNNVIVDAHCQTRVPGLYAAGDVVSALDQLAVAVGHGAIAATAIHNGLPAHQPTSGAGMAIDAAALAAATPSAVLPEQHRKMAEPFSARR